MRPKPPISAWIIEQRKLKGWKPRELARLLLERGCQAQEGTVRTWEAGRSPRADTIAELERLFGSPAPAQQESGDLVDAIRAQTEAMRALVGELKEAREARLGQDEALAEALGTLAKTLGQLGLAHNGRSQ